MATKQNHVSTGMCQNAFSVAEVRVRASSGTSFRTPALYELYLADQTSFTGQRRVDPCIRWGTNLADGSISQRLADNCAADGIAPDFTGAPISATIVTKPL